MVKLVGKTIKIIFMNFFMTPTSKTMLFFLNDLHFGYCAFCYINNSEQIDKLLIYLGNPKARRIGLEEKVLGVLLI